MTTEAIKVSFHARAVLQAVLVTFLWSTSWVLIKLGLREAIPPLTFAGLRYGLAFLILCPILLRRRDTLSLLRGLNRDMLLRLAVLGLVYYAITMGAQFVALKHLPAVTVNLLLSFSAVAVAGLGILLLNERPSQGQWGGVGLYLLGALVYFYPVSFSDTALLGIGVALVGVAANAVSSVLGRAVNRGSTLPPLFITVVTMGIGSSLLLSAGLMTEELPPLSAGSWLLILWLALVNTAFAFTLWNHSLRVLSALESSVINNLMMIQIPVMAWLFLGETMTGKEILGLLVAGIGILIVQLRRRA